MFFQGSRYQNAGTYTLTLADGTRVTATQIPRPRATTLLGYHQRLQGQRLDLIAAHYLKDATGFWQLCDANNTIVPDALAARAQVGIPARNSQ